jgi:hypothetical protein
VKVIKNGTSKGDKIIEKDVEAEVEKVDYVKSKVEEGRKG